MSLQDLNLQPTDHMLEAVPTILSHMELFHEQLAGNRLEKETTVIWDGFKA